MMANKTRPRLFDRLKAGLEESIAHAKGELTLKTVTAPDAPPEIDGKTIAALRESARMSQAVFASMLFVSLKTVQSWEQGARVPSMAARRLLHLFADEPTTFCRVVGLPAVKLHGFRIVDEGRGRRRIVRGSKAG
jgi:putative transcriptional regulator